jgi:uncharacterized integral membrane protein (TIGR00697 family)
MKTYRYLDLLTVLSITFVLVSDVTAPRLISVWGTAVSVTVLYFPCTYLLGDVLTEVYGHRAARRVAWWCLVASVISGCVYQGVLSIPSIDPDGRQVAYGEVLGAVPRTLFGGWLALWSGMTLNNYVMAKLKVLTGGRHLWLRAMGSTIAGELLNTAIFYLVALTGILTLPQLASAILIGSAIKIGVEGLMLPITYRVVALLTELESAHDHWRSVATPGTANL